MGQQEGEAENRSSIAIAKREWGERWRDVVGGVTEATAEMDMPTTEGVSPIVLRRKLGVHFQARKAERYTPEDDFD